MPLPHDAAPLTLAAMLRAQEELGQPNPARPWMPEVGAGGHGMPYLPPLPRRPPGEMRSGNEFALSDYIAEMTGSPLAGVITDRTAKFGRATGDALAGSTMMPWAYDVGSELGKSAAQNGFRRHVQARQCTRRGRLHPRSASHAAKGTHQAALGRPGGARRPDQGRPIKEHQSWPRAQLR